MHTKTIQDEKTAVNLRIRSSLKQQAKQLGVNLSQTLEQTLEKEIKRRKEQQWREENKAAIEAYNQRVEERGLALSKFRQF